MSQFKYKTSFSQQLIGAYAVSKLDFLEKDSLAGYFSSASLQGLSSLIPKDIDLDKNIDLIATAFNAAVVNSFNKNGDGIDSETALAIKNYFVHKPTNIEHKKQKVVGHIVSSAFSSYGGNELISDKEALSRSDPFNIALGAVVYKTVNKAFAELLDNEDGESFLGSVSASWELGFNDYVIALGGNDLKDSEIISNEKQIEELSKYLKANDGAGCMDDGTEVNRLIVGDIFPLGIGYTMNPAADVQGLYVKTEEKEGQVDSDSIADCELKNTQNIKKVSHNNENNVILTQEPDSQHMENQDILKKLEEVASSQKFSEEAVASIGQIVRDAIREKSEQYVQEREAIDAEKLALKEAEEQMKSEAKELSEKLEVAQEQINKLQEQQDQAKAQQVFNSRMDVIDNTYELEDADREVLANELNSLDVSDETFASYQEKLAVMWKHKDKSAIEAQEKAVQTRIDEAVEKRLSELSEVKANEAPAESEKTDNKEESKEGDLEEALENAEAVSQEISSNNIESVEKEQTLKQKFQSLFNRDNIKVTY